jgi:hypothetical protein
MSRALYDRQTMERRRVVAALTARARRRRQNPNLLVVAQCRRADAGAARDLGNRHARHQDILFDFKWT